MSLKATFAACAVAFLTLKTAMAGDLDAEQSQKLDEAIESLNKAQEDYETFIAADVSDAVDKALTGGLGDFSARHSELHGGHEDRIANLEKLANVTREPELSFVPPVSGSPEAGGPVPGLVHADTVIDKVVDVATGAGGTFTQGNASPTGGADTETPDLGETATQPIGEVADPVTVSDTPLADETAGDIVPGAATGPDDAGVVRNEGGYVADAPTGSMDAAFAGVQKSNTTGEVASTGTAPAAEVDTAQVSKADDGAAEEAHHAAAVEGADGAEGGKAPDGSDKVDPPKDETPAEKKAREKAEKAEQDKRDLSDDF